MGRQVARTNPFRVRQDLVAGIGLRSLGIHRSPTPTLLTESDTMRPFEDGCDREVQVHLRFPWTIEDAPNRSRDWEHYIMSERSAVSFIRPDPPFVSFRHLLKHSSQPSAHGSTDSASILYFCFFSLCNPSLHSR